MENNGYEEDDVAASAEIPAPLASIVYHGGQTSHQGRGQSARSASSGDAGSRSQRKPQESLRGHVFSKSFDESSPGYTKKATVVYGQRGQADVTFINIGLQTFEREKRHDADTKAGHEIQDVRKSSSESSDKHIPKHLKPLNDSTVKTPKQIGTNKDVFVRKQSRSSNGELLITGSSVGDTRESGNNIPGLKSLEPFSSSAFIAHKSKGHISHSLDGTGELTSTSNVKSLVSATSESTGHKLVKKVTNEIVSNDTSLHAFVSSSSGSAEVTRDGRTYFASSSDSSASKGHDQITKHSGEKSNTVAEFSSNSPRIVHVKKSIHVSHAGNISPVYRSTSSEPAGQEQSADEASIRSKAISSLRVLEAGRPIHERLSVPTSKSTLSETHKFVGDLEPQKVSRRNIVTVTVPSIRGTNSTSSVDSTIKHPGDDRRPDSILKQYPASIRQFQDEVSDQTHFDQTVHSVYPPEPSGQKQKELSDTGGNDLNMLPLGHKLQDFKDLTQYMYKHDSNYPVSCAIGQNRGGSSNKTFDDLKVQVPYFHEHEQTREGPSGSSTASSPLHNLPETLYTIDFNTDKRPLGSFRTRTSQNTDEINTGVKTAINPSPDTNSGYYAILEDVLVSQPPCKQVSYPQVTSDLLPSDGSHPGSHIKPNDGRTMSVDNLSQALSSMNLFKNHYSRVSDADQDHTSILKSAECGHDGQDKLVDDLSREGPSTTSLRKWEQIVGDSSVYGSEQASRRGRSTELKRGIVYVRNQKTEHLNLQSTAKYSRECEPYQVNSASELAMVGHTQDQLQKERCVTFDDISHDLKTDSEKDLGSKIARNDTHQSTQTSKISKPTDESKNWSDVDRSETYNQLYRKHSDRKDNSASSPYTYPKIYTINSLPMEQRKVIKQVLENKRGKMSTTEDDLHLDKTYSDTDQKGQMISGHLLSKSQSTVKSTSESGGNTENINVVSENIEHEMPIDRVKSWVTETDLRTDRKSTRHSIAEMPMKIVAAASIEMRNKAAYIEQYEYSDDEDVFESSFIKKLVPDETQLELDPEVVSRQDPEGSECHSRKLSRTVSDDNKSGYSDKRTSSKHFQKNKDPNPDEIIEMGDFDSNLLSRSESTRQSLNEFNPTLFEGWKPSSPYANRIQRNPSARSDSSLHNANGKPKIRQLSLAIGEEWEDMTGKQPVVSPDVLSSASSPHTHRSHRRLRSHQLSWSGSSDYNWSVHPRRNFRYMSHPARLENYLRKNMIQEEGEPVVTEPCSSTVEIQSDEHKQEEDKPADIKRRWLLPNPYNRINQRFHSTLQCPCCLFFCFLCCVPAVYFMQISDKEFDYGSEEKARVHGKRATILYVIGTVSSVILLTSVATIVVIFLQEYLTRKQT